MNISADPKVKAKIINFQIYKLTFVGSASSIITFYVQSIFWSEKTRRLSIVADACEMTGISWPLSFLSQKRLKECLRI